LINLVHKITNERYTYDVFTISLHLETVMKAHHTFRD